MKIIEIYIVKSYCHELAQGSFRATTATSKYSGEDTWSMEMNTERDVAACKDVDDESSGLPGLGSETDLDSSKEEN